MSPAGSVVAIHSDLPSGDFALPILSGVRDPSNPELDQSGVSD